MNVAMIGCGAMGGLHAAMATAAGLKVTVCADFLRKAADALAAPYGAHAQTDCMDALARPDVDVVAITVPTPMHAEYIKAAAHAGKHIFCEKPFCRTVAECRACIEAVEKAGVKLFVGHVVRYFHEFEALRDHVASGRIGKPGYAKLYRGGIYPGTEDSWYRDYAQSGGVTFDSAIHDLDWVRYTFGEPERIYCKTLQRKEPETLDYTQITLRMESGLIATVIGTWAHPSGFQVKAEICGDGGMVTYDSDEESLAGEKRERDETPRLIVPGNPVAVSPYQRQWEDFVGWLENRHEPRVKPEDALRAVEMASAALESNDTGEPVQLGRE